MNKKKVTKKISKIYTKEQFESKLFSLRETLSDLEHQQWAHWTDYLFKRLSLSPNVLKVDAQTKKDFERWIRQIITPYKDLSEKEKDADRVWADKVLKVLRKEFEDLLYFATDE